MIATDGGGCSDAQASADGRWLSWLAAGDLWLHEINSGLTTRATDVGLPPIEAVELGTYHGNEGETLPLGFETTAFGLCFPLPLGFGC